MQMAYSPLLKNLFTITIFVLAKLNMKTIKNIIKKILMAVIILVALYRVTAQSQTFTDLEELSSSINCGDMIYKNFEFYQNETSDVLTYSGDSKDPDFVMYQNYPNPFNSLTLIEFRLTGKCYAIIQVTDAAGNLVETIADGEMYEGDHFIFYKPDEKYNDGEFKCKMDVYSEDGNTILYSSEKTMTLKKADYTKR